MRILQLISGITLLFLWGCQPNNAPAEPHIFGDLYVRYLEDGQLLKAEASFFEGDSASAATPISILGGVTFQGSGMEQRNLRDKLIRYKYESTSDYPGQFTFQVQDEQGKARQFQIQMPPVSRFALPDTLLRGNELVIEIYPAPQSQEEELSVLCTDSTGKASLLEIPAPISTQNRVAPAQLPSLIEGNYQVYLIRKLRGVIHEDMYRVSWELEFYSREAGMRFEYSE